MKILLATDGSASADYAVETVAARMWPADTFIRVLAAVQTTIPPGMALWHEAGGSVERVRQDIESYADQAADRAVRLLQAKGLNAEAVVRHGDARSVIVDEAEQWDADLIVVGSHGYTGIRRWLLGSVAQAVVNHAPCSVEVVRMKQPRPEEQPPAVSSISEDQPATPLPIPPA